MTGGLNISFSWSIGADGSVKLTGSCGALEAWATGGCGCFDCKSQVERTVICLLGAQAFAAGYPAETSLHWWTITDEQMEIDLGFLVMVEGLGDGFDCHHVPGCSAVLQ